MYQMGLTQFETISVWVVLGIAIVGLLYAILLRRQVLANDKGTAKMIEVWDAIRQGADAYLSQQLRTILPLIVILTFAMFFSVYIVPPTAAALERFGNLTPSQVRMVIGLGRAGAFIMGALFSLTVGQIGMRMAVQANVRVAQAARSSFNGALRIAYRAGTVTGMLTDGLGLFGGTIIFIIFGVAAPDALLGFGFGGTLLALFMRVGGGIYTKAADVGADLVGKVERDMPEDDPRNAAVIADLVGDNVGDCAGMAADIFESYEVTIVSALILGLALRQVTGNNEWLIYPLLVRGIGVISSIVGTYLVKSEGKGSGDAMSAIFRGFLTSAAISTVLFLGVAILYMRDVPGGWWRPFLATAAGVLLAIIIDRITEHFTGTEGLAGARDQEGPRHRPGHHDSGRPGCGHGVRGLGYPGDRRHDLGLDLYLPGRQYRTAGTVPLCTLWRRLDRHRHVDADRQQRSHGLLRPHLRQRQRHRRDGWFGR